MVATMSSSWKEACGKKKQLQTGEGTWKLRGSSDRLRQQAGQEGYMQRQFSGKGDTEDLFLLRTDASCRHHLTEGNLLAQIGEGLDQSHTTFRAFPILLPSQPQGTKITPLELTDSPLPQGRPLQRECYLSGTAFPRLEEGEMGREEAA